MWALYNNPSTKFNIFNKKNIQQIKKLVIDYNYIQSLLVIKNQQKLKTRIIQQNLPNTIEKLQCLFLESFPISILAVYEISISPGSILPGNDEKKFKTLKTKKNEFQRKILEKTNYHKKCNKTYRTWKEFPSQALISNEILKRLKLELIEENLKFRFKLLQQCNLKTLQKNYKGNSLKKVLIQKPFLKSFQCLAIPILRDRVLQQIVV